MTRACWWLADKLSRTLEADERDAVRGDFAESGATGGQALREMLGLAARRQAGLWRDWRPWLALIGIAVPTAVILRQFSHSLHGSFLTYVVIPWQFGVRYRTGLTLTEDITVFVSLATALIVCSWTGGFALGSLSSRTVRVQGALFCLIGTLPVWMLFVERHPWIGLLLLVWQVAFLLVPAVWGARRAVRRGDFGLSQTFVVAFTVTSLIALAAWTGTWQHAALEAWSEGAYQGRDIDWPRRLLLHFVLVWPALYLVCTAISRHRKSRTLSC
ncbi:MAG: hypothetical protein O2968_07040 [Acidobacteria bacterium]|nr:hypothetical protein [Acidobacteriota bacterium]